MAEPKQSKLHKNEGLKVESNFLRGSLAESLSDPLTGYVSAEDAQLTKFHGIYMQDDRDVRAERRKKKLDKAYSFMIRVRVPGGVCTPDQWLKMDALSDRYANGTLKLTTRQAFQFHGIIKGNLKSTMKGINAAVMDTIAACGDVNRNVMCNPNPYQSTAHAEAQELAQAISDHLTPQTGAYAEIWLDGEKLPMQKANPDSATEEGEEPIYGKTYLPRKFKTVVAVPPSNDVDLYAHDLGFIAVVDKAGKVTGYNVSVGGGMGMTHGVAETRPRLAEVMGFCTPEQAVEVAEKVVLVQRDFGDRENRAHARLKYTIEDRGLDWFRGEVEKRLGYKLKKAKPFKFEHTGDRYGWVEDHEGYWHLTLFIQNGRVKDEPGARVKTGLREIAKIHQGDFRLTCNQNLMIARISADQKDRIQAMIEEFGILDGGNLTGLRKNSMACVALPTCGLALAESERYLPDLVTDVEQVLEELDLAQDDIVIRMTGCPNGCARPYLAEIGFVGKAPGKYNLYLGAAPNGSRLARLYRENVVSEDIVDTLRPILTDYKENRKKGEPLGDYCMRAGYVEPFDYAQGMNYHEPATK
jgi:sulfite reductase (NADPH) hemoprotein beta-component